MLTLEFPRTLDSLAGEPMLLIDGWVEYPYSQTNFAAWQAGAAYEAPTLEAYAGGAWHTVAAQFGYPAGMPRRMSMPLAELRETIQQEVEKNPALEVVREAEVILCTDPAPLKPNGHRF